MNLALLKKSLLFAFLILALPPMHTLQARQKAWNAAEIQLALQKLNVLGSVLYVAAHPDDENTRLIAYMANEKLMRTVYLSITRGDGGQNLVGKENGPLMGINRTQELLEARRLDGGEQWFTRANDFGYSKTPEETLTIWNEEKILGDVVWAIRKLRPDVIITRFPDVHRRGHGHHTASAILARKAFHVAADPEKYPEHLSEVSPWQATRLFHNTSSWWRKDLKNIKVSNDTITVTDIGMYNPLIGKSYGEIAAESRSQHKSQGFGSSRQRGSRLEYLQQWEGADYGDDIFEGIDVSWDRVGGGERVAPLVQEAIDRFDPLDPAASVSLLIKIHDAIQSIDDPYWKSVKTKAVKELIRACAGLWFELQTDHYTASPGDSVRLKAVMVMRLKGSVVLRQIVLNGNPQLEKPIVLEKDQFLDRSLVFRMSGNQPYSHPYWLTEPMEKGAYVFDTKDYTIGQPENDPAFSGTFDLAIDGRNLTFDAPLVYRWTDPVKGEQYRPFVVSPRVTANFEDPVYLFTENNPKPVWVQVGSGNGETLSGKISLEAGEGWQVSPAFVDIPEKTTHFKARFLLQPPAKQNVASLKAVVHTGNGQISRSITRIEHDHIQIQTLFPEAEARAIRLDLRKKGEKIGYIMGAGDDIPANLAQIGYTVDMIGEEDMKADILNTYPVIVLGIRAYNSQQWLHPFQDMLMAYVEQGGHLICQYNSAWGLKVDNIGPYPFKLSRDRVTVEEAPVTFLQPEHPLLNVPNKITPADFDGWVQERGLYFAGQWDDQYDVLFAANDPGESAKKGSLLVCRYGKGTYIYCGLSFFRQLPAAVPGAYRLFANLLSYEQ